MAGYALYRLPRTDRVDMIVQTHGDVEELGGYEELNGRSGFVIAPFAITKDTPLLLIREDEKICFPQEEIIREAGVKELSQYLVLSKEDYNKNILLTSLTSTTEEELRNIYGNDFRSFHKALCEGRFSKLVLARMLHIEAEKKSPISLFAKACELYPRMFISLVSTPQSGTWLMATPETLLDSDGKGVWRTMALAGTMRLEGKDLEFDNPSRSNVQDIKWSQKNIQEQRYVSTYIYERLKPLTNNIKEDGPYTTRAADLVHLRSDFTFTMDKDKAGSTAETLHPTPAVCGIPKSEARDFIIRNEHTDRRYYSGFAGILSGEESSHLFVSLRCMEICRNGYNLYAGGGILTDSIEQTEWEETSAKLETMRRLL